MENSGAVGGKLERVAITACNEDDTVAFFFFCRSSGEKIICLEARRLRILKTTTILFV
jgi:hypothetical protein